MRRGRRRADRRARRRRGEARPDADDVFGARPQSAAAREVRIRRQGPAQPRKDVPATAPLRRARPLACPCWAAAIPRYPEVLVMRFGLFCSPKADAPGFRPETGRGFFDYLEFNIEAETLGCHSSFSVEHHFSGWNQVSSTLMLLSALAMRTTTLRLGTAVIVLPWHNPVLLAEEAATLDLLSHGRLDLGIGKGYRHSEFKGFQISPDEAEARFDEAVEVMTRAWTTREQIGRAHV